MNSASSTEPISRRVSGAGNAGPARVGGWAQRFFLGTHQPSWLADPRVVSVPLFVSRRTLMRRKALPRAVGKWSLDSGGFSELSLHGAWTITARQYAAEVRRYRDEIGGLAWAAPQDWMCEAVMLAKTGLSVEKHQARTVANFIELRSIAPDIPIIPVIQGWNLADYWRCEDLYRRAGVDLSAEPLVGVGTVCRRQGTSTATRIMRTLAASGLSLHGFGFKRTGLLASASDMASADSMAWSYSGRRSAPLPGHDVPGEGRRTGHINCANCIDFALIWLASLLTALADARSREQLDLFGKEAA